MYMKKFLMFIIFAAFPLLAMGQASGGQITRKKPKVAKTKRANNVSRTNNQSESAIFTPYQKKTASAITPIYMSSLSKYNVVAKSWDSLTSAQYDCLSLRSDGYTSYIYYDSSTQMYYVLIYPGTNSEQKALQNRRQAREKYPAAWIMCVENGRTYRYGSFDNDISSTPVQTKPVVSAQRKSSKSSIEPISISSLQKYNVVVESWISLASAQLECQKLRDNGFHSEIILDTSNMYRVLMYSSSNSEEDARRYRNKAIAKYPKAWIMCVENGRTYKYDK